MQRKFKLGALAWGIAAAMAFPAGAGADTVGTLIPSVSNNAAVCNQLATGNTNGANQCRQDNTATNSQTTSTTGGNGGTATGGNAGPSQVGGNGSQAGSSGGSAYPNGGYAESDSSLDSDQSNQISGRDSSLGSYAGEGDNNSDVCKQLAPGNAGGDDQCRQSNTATNTQTTTTTGGNGGSATGGNAGPTQVVGDGSQASSQGGDAYANGGYAESDSSLENEQSNQISGRDSSGSDPEGVGNNNAAVCNQLATGNAQGNDQCH